MELVTVVVETVLTTWVTLLLEEARYAVLPEYSAVSAWLPDPKESVEKMATPVVGSTLAVPITVLPSLKVIKPPFPPAPPVTVAVRVTDVPGFTELFDPSTKLTLDAALAIWMVNDWLVLLAPLNAFTSTTKEPLDPSSGVPERTPSAESVRPAGSASLVLKVKVLGLPVAAKLKLLAVPMVKLALLLLMMDGGPNTSSVKGWMLGVTMPLSASTAKL